MQAEASDLQGSHRSRDPSLLRILADIAAGRAVEFAGVGLVSARVHGRRVHFVTDLERDPIQRSHRAGRFYESTETALIRQVFPPGGVFVDIGANFGHHGLYAALFCHATRVYPVEPNPSAWRLLLANVLANGAENMFDFRGLGLGAGARSGEGYSVTERQTNRGAARMIEGVGAIPVQRGDDLLADVTPDFIKIDVEGMEFEVLSGLSGVLARCSPGLMVEVATANEDAFQAWVAENGYAVTRTTQPYRANRNHVLRPRRKRLAAKALEAAE